MDFNAELRRNIDIQKQLLQSPLSSATSPLHHAHTTSQPQTLSLTKTFGSEDNDASEKQIIYLQRNNEATDMQQLLEENAKLREENELLRI